MDVSPDQIDKSRRTIRAAGVFADNAAVIVTKVVELPQEHVVVAIVRVGYDFGGAHHVPRAELVEKVSELEGDGGWAMVFSPGADADHVAARTSEMVKLAEKRIAMLEKIAARSDGG
jgi:hypothetical protein